MAASPAELFDTLVQIWTDQFGAAWEAMAGARPEINAQAPASAPTSEKPVPVWYRFAFGKESGADFYVGSGHWEKLGSVVLAAAGVETPSPADVQGTCLEMLNQAASGVARALTKQVGQEILAASGVDCSAPQENLSRTSLRLRIEENDHELLLVSSDGFPSLLLSPSVIDRPLAAPSPQTAVADARSNGMDLLLDVELPVSVSFGRAQLALKDVLKLTTGSIVELNRSVSEPVEVIVNNCVIARGEVVVVEGNFGVRIRQVVSRQERLQSLK